jgi:ubiquinone/menaquinone biosynthesis C-methylase UbiE
MYALFVRNPRSSRLLSDLISPSAGHSVLDIGCGPGAAVRTFAPHVWRAVGVDRSPAMVRIASRRSRKFPNVSFTAAPAEALPFSDDEFDVVWTIQAYHHWEAPASGLAEAQRVLRPEGSFLIIETKTSGSHGLSRAAAEHLLTRLELANFVDTAIDEYQRHIVVRGVAGW